ncbi:MBL fold metallo-hydrolase [Haloferula helveola]|uniref:MBL fold metallo-hydrolase n=1 Tax=Haloferula helveola TaxID=490095 RepID=A0ABM7RJ59_9BACT|nr:MBL fold metallo-hydrolase [Haloferula helveola]
MFLRQITDSSLAQNAYLIGCQRTGEAVVIDPERDVDRYIRIAEENDLRLSAVADTHIHADYLTGARELIERHKAKGYLSAEGGEEWQFEWAKGQEGVTLLHDGDSFRVGNIEIKAILTPGHTPEHMSFLVIDHGSGAKEPMAILSGDFIFVGDVGRPDLLESAAGQAGAMEPSARVLFESLRRTSELPGFLQVLPAHGAGSACGKALGAVPTSVLDYERRHNAAFRLALEGEENEFVGTILDGQPEPPLYFARMKRDNRSGPALLPDGKLPEPSRIQAGDLANWIGAERRTILDLRRDRAAFMERHLQGALFAPIGGSHFSFAAGSYVDEDDEILLLVEDDEDVDQAVRELVRIGLDRVVAWIPVVEALKDDALAQRIRRIPTSELASSMDADEGSSVIDVRGAGEHAARHVKGSINVAHTRLAARLDEVPSEGTLLVHCASGMRASLAAAYLASTGREVVHVDGPFGEVPDAVME